MQASSEARVFARGVKKADARSIKARSILDNARLVNPANEVLWTEAVRVEDCSGVTYQAKHSSGAGCQSDLERAAACAQVAIRRRVGGDDTFGSGRVCAWWMKSKLQLGTGKTIFMFRL